MPGIVSSTGVGALLQPLWKESLGDDSVTIAVLDGMPDLAHPCFRDATLGVLETTFGGTAATRHATQVASVIFGQHGSGVDGVAPRCRGLIVPVYPANGRAACTQADLARAIDMAVIAGADVINISGGESADRGELDPELAIAIARASQAGAIVVAAAGNDACDCARFPAALDGVLAVGACDAAGAPIAMTNWGAHHRGHGILAPGADIVTALPDGGSTRASGTSYAAAIVSGVAALLLVIAHRDGHARAAELVRRALLASRTGCGDERGTDCDRLLGGRLDPQAALSRVRKGERMTEDHLETRGAPPGEGPPPFDVPEEARAGVEPLGCGCGGSDPQQCSCKTPPAPELKPERAHVYALGQIGYDFRSESRRAALAQQTGVNVNDPEQFLAHLEQDPTVATAVTWTLEIDGTPIYAIVPAGAYATVGYQRLREFVAAQLRDGVELVSLPGTLAGITTLLSGLQVPVVVPEVRGMYSWSTAALAGGDDASGEVHNFLERIYYELRNRGMAPQDRAINFAATNAVQARNVFTDAIKAGMSLDDIVVERSPIARPGADAWDVRLTFFHPSRRLEQARRVYRFTIDVSDVIPVAVGGVRSWHIY